MEKENLKEDNKDNKDNKNDKDNKIGKKKGLKKMAKWQKAMVLVLGLFLIFAVVMGLTQGKKPPVQVSSGLVEIASIEQVVNIKGVIKGSDFANIYSSANYRISSILVNEGDTVAAGQILATLDAQELKDKYAQAAITVNQAKRAFDIAKDLYEQGASSQMEYLKAKDDYSSAVLNASSYNLKEATNITSPIGGTITRVNASVGKIAAGGSSSEPLFVVENLDNLQMKVGVGEYEIKNIKEGQMATITAEVLGDKEVKGMVTRISPTGERKDASTTEMVIPVTIEVEKGAKGLISGITAKAKILVDKRENTLTVPMDAVLENPETEETYVLRLDDNNIIEKVKVKVGLEGNLRVEVLETQLKEGDKVVLAPTLLMEEGSTVTLANTPAGIKTSDEGGK